MSNQSGEPTLAELFPNLAPALNGMEGWSGSGNDPLRTDPDHHGVTDADISAYFADRLNGGGRTLAPVVPGQVPVGQTFRSGTTGAPPPVGQVDGPGTTNESQTPATPPRQGNQPPDPSPPVQPAEMPQPLDGENEEGENDDPDEDSTQGGTGQEATDEAGTGTGTGQPDPNAPPATPPPAFVEVNGQQVPLSRIQAYEEFNNRLASDPQLAQLIQEYVTTGRVPGAAPGTGGEGGTGQQTTTQPPSPQPQPSPYDAPPADYADDPAFMALWNANKIAYEAQQATIAQLTQSQMFAQQRLMQEEQVRNEAIVNQAATAFQTRMNVTPEELATLRATATRLNVLPSLLSGIDPLTGAPTSPDPIAAVDRALEIAYFSIPEFRGREVTAATNDSKKERAKKAKIGSLSGSSGSVPRSNPAPTTPQGNRAAMLAEVSEMMSGTWAGNGS